MRIRHKRVAITSLLGAVLLLSTGYFLGRARADDAFFGEGAMVYRGVLLDNGAPVDGNRDITVALFDSEAGNGEVCKQSQPQTPVHAGRFEVSLPESCVRSIQASAPLWVQVAVGSTVLTRTRVSGVPYAVVASKALTGETRIGESGIKKRISRMAVFKRTTEAATTLADTGSFKNGLTAGAISITGLAPGYASAKRACEMALGTDTAHMCTNEEMLASAQMGLDPPALQAWVSSGTYDNCAVYNKDTETSQKYLKTDCEGWSAGTIDCSPNNKCLGAMWWAARPSHGYCDALYPVACCDDP